MERSRLNWSRLSHRLHSRTGAQAGIRPALAADSASLSPAPPDRYKDVHTHAPEGSAAPGRAPPLCEVASRDGEGDVAHFECNCVDMICPASAEPICCVITAALAGSMPAWAPLSIPDGGITALDP